MILLHYISKRKYTNYFATTFLDSYMYFYNVMHLLYWEVVHNIKLLTHLQTNKILLHVLVSDNMLFNII